MGFSLIEQNIIKKLHINSDKKLISVIDTIKLLEDYVKDNKLKKILKTIQPCSNLEQFIKNITLDPNYKCVVLLGQNFYTNIYNDIDFIISNPYLFKNKIFENLYDNLEEINKIPKLLIKIWNMVINSDLKDFYNRTIIKKWIKTMNYKKLSKEEYIEKIGKFDEDIYLKYEKIFKVFMLNVNKSKKLVLQLDQIYSNINSLPGLGKLDPTYYLYLCKFNVGLPIGTEITFKKLIVYAINELNRLENKLRKEIHIVRPELSKLKIKEIIQNINADKKLKPKSEKQFVQMHLDIMKKYHDFYVKEKKFPELAKPNIVHFNDKNKSGGYWFNDTFYLNTYKWDEINLFEVESLVLHETIPGHHTQVSWDLHAPLQKSELLLSIFNVLTNGFCEGWGLFAEKLGFDQTPWDRIGQIQYEMLRTLRIIADISIHKYGFDYKDIINFMSKYLAMSYDKIELEVLRYVNLPAQALCYKIGKRVFEVIIKKHIKKFKLKNSYISEEIFDFYKEIIINKSMPLELLLKKYNIKYDELF